jgi:hypothetical protein
MPIGIMRGELLKLEYSEIYIKNTAGVEYRCGFDQRTYFEREKLRSTASAMHPGDSVEVVADRRPGSSQCYARMVHVVDQKTLRQPKVRPAEIMIPRGNMTFTGWVVRPGPRALVLKTKDGMQTLLLRPDTRYFGEGLRVDNAALSVNTRVFVRAGKNLDNEIEAYQVIWGNIVQPK